MKRSVLFNAMTKAFVILAASASLFLTSCQSTKVRRVDSDTVTDLNGYWNDTDIKIVCDSLIKDCCSSPRIQAFTRENGRSPVVIIGQIRNMSDEHIDTSIVAKKFQSAIINSGVLEFVSDASERQLLRDERKDQQVNATETAKEQYVEQAADYMLLGSIKTVVQKEDNKSVRAYFVTVELHDLQTNKIIWSGDNSEIKKVITTPKNKL